MIKIKSLLIENLRGIKRFSYDLDSKNTVIHGPNGSGKSGVIDSIEFALTGNMCRLSGVGTREINVTDHAPHVDSQNDLKSVKVTIEVINHETQNCFTIERCVKNPREPKILPANEEANRILRFLSDHPEFSLSRKEILKFIVSEPGKRAKDVQILLKIDAVDKTRTAFTKFKNEINTTSKDKLNASNHMKQDILRHFEINTISKELILNVVNNKRDTLGLEKIHDISEGIKFSLGFESDSQKIKQLVDKKTFQNSVNQLLSNLKKQPKKENDSNAVLALLANDKDLQNIKKQDFYELGLDQIIDDVCPFCDNSYDLDLLVKHIKQKIEQNKKYIVIKESIETESHKIKTYLNKTSEEITEIIRNTKILGLTDEYENLSQTINLLKEACDVLTSPLDNLSKARDLFENRLYFFNSIFFETLETLLSKITSLPDFSTEEEIKRFLIVADEKLMAYQKAKREHAIWQKRADQAKTLLSLYEEASENQLKALYKDIESTFSALYSEINSDDEDNFSAQLSPNSGALHLEVDFYGRGAFPPNAFHSEGHQDGMGLCLYLALSKKLLNEKFTFCLLDDVLMSVDTNHRRQFCKLLKSNFPHTQFIITTHDDVWKKQLISESIVTTKQVINFRGWSVDTGPVYLDEKETTEEISSLVDSFDISKAAPLLRQYLEFVMNELSIKFRCRLEVKYTATHDPAELVQAVISQFKNYLSKAKKAARSWNQTEKIDLINSLDEALTQSIKNYQLEQWTLNPLVHYNERANFTQSEFRDLMNAFYQLFSQFKCPECKTWLYATPQKGNVEQLRCECGGRELNFKLNTK